MKNLVNNPWAWFIAGVGFISLAVVADNVSHTLSALCCIWATASVVTAVFKVPL